MRWKETAAPEFTPFLDPLSRHHPPSQLPAEAGEVEFGFLKNTVVLDMDLCGREGLG